MQEIYYTNKQGNNSYIQWVIITMVLITEVSTDMLAPCLPAIKTFYDTTNQALQHMVSINFFGLVVSGLILGPLSDHLGRKKVMQAGMIIFASSSLACFFADNIQILTVCRFVQGIGSGVGIVGFALITDIYNEIKCGQVISTLSVAIALSRGISPIVAGYISLFLGWKTNFLVISFLSIISLLYGYFYLPNTYSTIANYKIPMKTYFQAAKSGILLLKNHKFLIFLFLGGLVSTRVFIESIFLPLIYIEQYKLSVEYYGYFTLFSVLLFVIGSIINKKYIPIFGVRKMLLIGVYLAIVTGILLTLTITCLPKTNPFLLETLKIPGAIALAFIVPNSTTLALNASSSFAGAGATIIKLMQTLMYSFGAYLAALFFDGTYLSIALIALTCYCISLYLFWLSS